MLEEGTFFLMTAYMQKIYIYIFKSKSVLCFLCFKWTNFEQKDKYNTCVLYLPSRFTDLAETGGPAEEDGPGHRVYRLVPGSHAAVSGW